MWPCLPLALFNSDETLVWSSSCYLWCSRISSWFHFIFSLLSVLFSLLLVTLRNYLVFAQFTSDVTFYWLLSTLWTLDTGFNVSCQFWWIFCWNKRQFLTQFHNVFIVWCSWFLCQNDHWMFIKLLVSFLCSCLIISDQEPKISSSCVFGCYVAFFCLVAMLLFWDWIWANIIILPNLNWF